jgi:hypothetical protein
MHEYIKGTERSKTNNLMLCLKLKDKQNQAEHKTSRRQIIKIRANINERETIQRINETKSWFFEKINKINKPLANLTKMRRENPKSVK